MRRLGWAAAVCLLFPAGGRGEEELGPQFVARTPPLSPEEERLKFHLPPGFEVELVAAEPDIRKPMNLAFDERGRIWATESVEYPFGVKEGEAGRDCIKVLEDTDGDGRADKVTRFAEGLNIPIGVIPLPDGAIGYSIPRVYRFIDSDGDSRADQRVELYGSFGHQDTHGMVNGFRLWVDGWLYACHGYSNTSEVKGSGGSSIRMNSGNIFRMRLDGSRPEQFTHGQVNPFGLCFDPLGNLFSADCHSQPGYQVLRGGYYPSFGKPHDGLGYAPEIMTHDHGSTAIAGVVYYAAEEFPPEYRGTIFLGNVVTNRINHDRLERHGASYKAVLKPDFLVSDDPWFRPVDLRLGPDGALYVADFYNRIIGHYEVPLTHPGRDRERGRIWRIYYKGPNGGSRPRRPVSDYRKADPAELVRALAHPNLAVRVDATLELARRGPAVLPLVREAFVSGPSPFERAHALWALERLGSLDERALAAAARDRDPVVRVHLQRILAERGGLPEMERDIVVAALEDPDAWVERAAAEALSTHPDSRNLVPLLALRKSVAADDTHLMHMVRMSLRNGLRLADAWPEVSKLGPEDRALIADVAPGVHSEASASFLREWLESRPEGSVPGADEVQYLARYLPEAERGRILPLLKRTRPDDHGRRVALLTAVQRGTEERGAKLGDDVLAFAAGEASDLLSSGDRRRVRSGIELVRGMRLAALEDKLRATALEKSAGDENRKLCLDALVSLDAGRQVPLLEEVLGDAGSPFTLREAAALQLGDVRTPEALDTLVRKLAVAPGRLSSRIAAALARSREGAERLLCEVERGKASGRLLRDREVEGRLSRSGLPEIGERLKKLTEGLPEVDERLEKLIAERKSGYEKASPSPARGAKVFEKSCAPCHRIADQGTKIGPELNGIGVRGLDRLLEDTLDPSRNVDKAFQTTVLVLKSNLLRSGLLLNEEGEVLVLADAEGKEVRVPKSELKSRETVPLSPMPANVAETVAEKDYYDLLSFLLERREKGPPAP